MSPKIVSPLLLSRSVHRPINLLIIATTFLCRTLYCAIAATPETIEFFEQSIRPILVNECYECHGAKKQKGGLRVDFREGLLKGGESGPALIPGKPQKSLLLRSLLHEIPESKMPKDRPQLSDAVIANFITWVDRGAFDPRDQAPTMDATNSLVWEATRNGRKDWWSFKPVQNPSVPVVKKTGGSDHPVDCFLLEKMEARGLKPAARANLDSLLRRATFVLTGLPPSSDEIESFRFDSSPDAYEKRLDALLASPRFGERWARHWMDLVRYCESHGSQGDPELPMAWRYRDYLIRAFNSDVPYNQLVREQIAGDLLPNPRLNSAESLNESKLGTAHLRMVELGFVPVDALDDQIKVVDNQIDVFSKAFLGLTVSCARCHDHKFDPISQKDFYALYGIFASSRPGQVVVDAPELVRTNRTELTALKREIRAGLAEAWASTRIGRELQDHTASRRERDRLDAGIRRVNESVSKVEARARGALTQKDLAGVSTTLPTPLAQWSFEKDLRDSIGAMHGKAYGTASVRNGRLILTGNDSWVTTDPLQQSLKEKTLEVWVALAELDQKGGGALTVQTLDSEIFDSIVFGERESARWIAGSDFFRRTRDFGGPAETFKLGEWVHLAAVYGADNSITLYRNGTSYGTSYQQGSLQTFTANQARVLLGKRHLGEGIASLSGEIEEARLYSRALSATEVVASFRAGTLRVDAATLTKALTSDEHQVRLVFLKELEQLQSDQSKQMNHSAAREAWNIAIADAGKNTSNPLQPWAKLSGLKDATFQEGWNELASYWKIELANRSKFNRTNFTQAWDMRGEGAGRWFMSDKGAGVAALGGEFSVEVKGDRVLRGLYTAGVLTHSLTSKQNGVFTSPRFKVTTDNISVRGLGQHSRARLVVENYAIGQGGLYPTSGLGSDEMKWFRMDTAYRKGSNAYLEFITADDSPNSDASDGGRAHFGAAEVVFHTIPEAPKELLIPSAFFLSGEAPRSVSELAELYSRTLSLSIARWQEGNASDEALTFLDYFIRHDLLPATLARLPQLGKAVAAYRQLEESIPVPRRAPGVHEAVAFDQPLFARGSSTQPGAPVPRRFLEMFDERAFPTTLSGRLELAEKVANPENPLTARVMVNRLWYHLFGRGLVGTVDNFGRLGEKPTHPELLDYLASYFIEHGWSMKQTLRFLMTSRAFQQSTIPSAEARRLDPSNELVSHGRVRRLEAETIRDAVLATSGQVDLKMYGPGVNVYYLAKTEGGGAKGPLDGDRRRSVYQRIRRNAANPFLEAFDAPKPMSTRGKRDATNVPAQSLTLLNDPFIIDQSSKWAKTLIAEGRTRDERVRNMFLKAFGRSASTEDLTVAREFLNELAAEHTVSANELQTSEAVWKDFSQSLFCLKEFIYVD